MEKICDLSLESLGLVLAEPKDASIVVDDVATFLEYCQIGNNAAEPSKIMHSYSKCFCNDSTYQCINVYLAVTNYRGACIYIMRRFNNSDDESIPYFNKIVLSTEDVTAIISNTKKVSFSINEEYGPCFNIGDNMYVFDDEYGPFIMQPRKVEDIQEPESQPDDQ